MGGRVLETHIGEKYNHLTITGVDRERMKKYRYSDSFVFADCDCGVCHKSYNFAKIKRGETKSCGHLKLIHKQRKTNTIILSNDYGIIKTSNFQEKEYMFDIEDIAILNGKYWYEDDYGYLTTAVKIDGKYKYLKFHRLVMNAEKGQYVDHKNRDRTDNRKDNLRICSHLDNDRNRSITKNNTSGIIGVGWIKGKNKWRAAIGVKGKTIHLGYFYNKTDAIKARLKAEKTYFGEFAPQTELFDKYLEDEK